MVDVSSRSCTITPTSPDGLDPTGGVIVDGTVNVMIECRCVNNDGSLSNKITWFDPTNTRLTYLEITPDDDDPYIIANNNNAGRSTTLVIPTFSDSTSGVYTCGIGRRYPSYTMVTINLTVGNGKCYHMHVLHFMVPQYEISVMEIHVTSLSILSYW